MFHEAEVAVHVDPEWSLYSKLTAGMAGDASLALATSETVPATFAFEAGLENVSDGGVLSTRVVIRLDVIEFPAASVAITRRS